MSRRRYFFFFLLCSCITIGMFVLTVVGYKVCVESYENQKTWIKVESVMKETKYSKGNTHPGGYNSAHTPSGYHALYAGSADWIEYEFWDSQRYDSEEDIPGQQIFYVNPENKNEYSKEIRKETRYYTLLGLPLAVFCAVGIVRMYRCRPGFRG